MAGAFVVQLESTPIQNKVRGINSVRALAALSVALAHIVAPLLPGMLNRLPQIDAGIADLSRYLFTGHPAVIAFFVVSGFCIHYPYTHRPLPILPFWAARWTRIMIPVLVAIVFAKLARLREYNFWDGYILWSIVCELFYYMLYPLFFWGSRRIAWRTQFYIALVLSFAIAICLGSDQYGNAHVYGPFLNWAVGLPSWLAGCVLAEEVRRVGTNSRTISRSRLIFVRCSVALIAASLYWLTMHTNLGYYLTMNGFALVAVLWVKSEIRSARPSDTLLEKTGEWSYSIYLMHMPAFLIFGRLFKHFWSEPMQIAFLPITLVCCFFFYRKVEQPAHDYARRLFRRTSTHGFIVQGKTPPGTIKASYAA